jgi:hypothetical protein
VEERRHYPRVAGPFEGHWHGGAEAREVRISEVSPAGCFVETMVQPVPGEETSVSIAFGPGQSMEITGHVASAEPGFGFAMKFDELTPADLDLLKKYLHQE